MALTSSDVGHEHVSMSRHLGRDGHVTLSPLQGRVVAAQPGRRKRGIVTEDLQVTLYRLHCNI